MRKQFSISNRHSSNIKSTKQMERQNERSDLFDNWYGTMIFDFTEFQWGDFAKISAIQKERSDDPDTITTKKQALESSDIVLDSELSLPFCDIIKRKHEGNTRAQLFLERFKPLQTDIAICSKTPELYKKHLIGKNNIKISCFPPTSDSLNMIVFSPEMSLDLKQIKKNLDNKTLVTFFGSPYNDEFWENLEKILTETNCEISVSFYYEFFPSPYAFGFSLYPSLQRPKPSAQDILFQRSLIREKFETIFSCQKSFDDLTKNEQRWALNETKISMVDSGF